MEIYSEIINKGIEKLEELEKAEHIRRFRGEGGGSETGKTVRTNKKYFQEMSFKMRVIDSEEAETGTKLFGRELETPIMNGPLSGLADIAQDPLRKIAEGVTKAGSIAWMGIGDESRLSSMTEVSNRVIKVVKPYREKEKIIKKVGKAEDLGVIAVGIDVDFILGGKSGDKTFRKELMGPKNFEDLEDIISTTDLPFILKGILSLEDARKAREVGADAIVVSNHGGAVLDHAAHPLQLLPEISDEVGDDLMVLVDSGFRRGTDVLKGLALGAEGVLLGRTPVIGLAADGADGVENLFRIVTEELARGMTLTGCSTLEEIDSEILIKD